MELLRRQFLEYLEIERGRSVKTIENYGRYLRRFFAFSAAQTPSAITDELIRRYRLSLNRDAQQGRKALKRKTQNYYLIALRGFLSYLSRRGIASLHADRIELAAVPQRELDMIGAEELARLLDAPSGDRLKTFRDRAILELLFSTGLRVAELCALNRDDIEPARGEFSVRGKGEKVRVVFLSDAARRALDAYKKKRVDAEEALFAALGKGRQSSGRLTPRSVERIVAFWARKAGIGKKVTPHVLRHAFATDLLINGADLRSVQELLGHANVTTTQIYTHITNPQLKEVHRAFHAKRRRG